jgi:hypothetical protein
MSQEARERVRDADVESRVRDALERAERSGVLHRSLDSHEWSSMESRRLGEEIRARVRESMDRSEAIRERNLERTLDEARRNSARLRDRHWY